MPDTQDPWARTAYSSSPSPDPEEFDDTPINLVSRDSDLQHELDLSTRDDRAVILTNPFILAKQKPPPQGIKIGSVAPPTIAKKPFKPNNILAEAAGWAVSTGEPAKSRPKIPKRATTVSPAPQAERPKPQASYRSHSGWFGPNNQPIPKAPRQAKSSRSSLDKFNKNIQNVVKKPSATTKAKAKPKAPAKKGKGKTGDDESITFSKIRMSPTDLQTSLNPLIAAGAGPTDDFPIVQALEKQKAQRPRRKSNSKKKQNQEVVSISALNEELVNELVGSASKIRKPQDSENSHVLTKRHPPEEHEEQFKTTPPFVKEGSTASVVCINPPIVGHHDSPLIHRDLPIKSKYFKNNQEKVTDPLHHSPINKAAGSSAQQTSILTPPTTNGHGLPRFKAMENDKQRTSVQYQNTSSSVFGYSSPSPVKDALEPVKSTDIKMFRPVGVRPNPTEALEKMAEEQDNKIQRSCPAVSVEDDRSPEDIEREELARKQVERGNYLRRKPNRVSMVDGHDDDRYVSHYSCSDQKGQHDDSNLTTRYPHYHRNEPSRFVPELRHHKGQSDYDDHEILFDYHGKDSISGNTHGPLYNRACKADLITQPSERSKTAGSHLTPRQQPFHTQTAPAWSSFQPRPARFKSRESSKAEAASKYLLPLPVNKPSPLRFAGVSQSCEIDSQTGTTRKLTLFTPSPLKEEDNDSHNQRPQIRMKRFGAISEKEKFKPSSSEERDEPRRIFPNFRRSSPQAVSSQNRPTQPRNDSYNSPSENDNWAAAWKRKWADEDDDKEKETRRDERIDGTMARFKYNGDRPIRGHGGRGGAFDFTG